MCRLRNIAMRDYQESVTTGQTDTGKGDPHVPLCFAGDRIIFLFMRILPRMNVMIDFICMDSNCEERKASENNKIKKSCPYWDSNPYNFQITKRRKPY